MHDKLPGQALVYTYRRLNRFFHAVSERVFEGPSTFCASWPGLEPINLQHEFYKHYRRRCFNHDLSDEEYFQIIARSCVLRLLPWEQSKRMVDAMYKTLDEITDKARPDYLFTVMVDNYMTDLLARICRKKGARVIMIAAGSLKKSIIVTSYGEFNRVREPGAEEIDAGVAALGDDAGRVTYGMRAGRYSFWRHLRTCGTWWAKCLYFRTCGRLLGDPLNFRFLMGSLPQRDGQSSLWNYRCNRFFNQDWEEQMARADRPALFIPLGYTPEASVSYWLRDVRYIDYEDFIVDAAEQLSHSYQVVIKEHWSVLGARRWQFYERLKAIPGTVLVPAEENSRKVMRKLDRVLVGAGTTGVEAAVRGKRVATLDKPYYFLEGGYLNVGNADRIKDLPQMLEAFEPPAATPEHQQALVRRMLQSTLVGHFLPDPYLDSEENYANVTSCLRDYLASTPRTANPELLRASRNGVGTV